MANSVIAVIFPDTVDEATFNAIVTEAKELFSNIPGISVKLATNDAAETIVFFCETGELPVDEDEESNLVSHARRELALAGNDEDFNISIISAIKAFSGYGHSGGSASVAIPMLNALLHYENLTPLTDDPKEWNNVSDISGEELWQSSRNAEAFSRDGGKTYYLLSENEDYKMPGIIHETVKKEE
jgi:hypothetical protein